MTKEEIIEQLNFAIDLIKQDGKDWLDDRDIPMLEECVKALSQESIRDMEEISEIMKCDADAETKCKMISNILTTKPHYFEEQEPTDRIEYGTDGNAYKLWMSNGKEFACDDAISREDAEECKELMTDINGDTVYAVRMSDIRELSSVTQKSDEQLYKNGFADGYEQGYKDAEPKTGHWILDETDNSITCDKCGCLIWANDISNGDAHYCPNCGFRMVEP